MKPLVNEGKTCLELLIISSLSYVFFFFLCIQEDRGREGEIMALLRLCLMFAPDRDIFNLYITTYFIQFFHPYCSQMKQFDIILNILS